MTRLSSILRTPALRGSLWALLWLMAWPAATWAQRGGPSIQVQANSRSIAYGQVLRLQVTVMEAGGSGGDLEPPPLGQWSVISQSRQMRYDGVSGRSQTILALGLRPEGVGSLTIGAFTLRTGGQVIKSDPMTIRVTGDGPKPPSPQGVFQGQRPDGEGPDELAFLAWEVDKEQPWLGEQVNANLYLYLNRRLSVGGVQASDINLEGFWNQPISGRSERPRQVTVAGRSYVREQIARYMLFPIRSGELTLPAVKLQMEARAGFGRRRQIERTAPALPLTVRALPAEGKPEGFAGPAVGQISLVATVDRRKIKADQGVQLTVVTRVRGLVKNVPPLELPDLPDLKSFPPTRDEDSAIRGADQLQGTRTATWLLRPTRAGQLQIPALTLPYFDPVAGRYKVARSRPMSLTVTGEVAPEAPSGDVAAGGEPAAERPGLRTIRKESDLASEGRPAYASPIFIALMCLPPLCLLGLSLRSRLGGKGGDDRAQIARAAAGEARRGFGALEGAQGGEAFTGISRVILHYLSQRFDTPLQGLTHDQLRDRLAALGVSEPTARSVVEELENCDFARFAPTGSRAGEHQEALARARGLVDRIEQEIA